MKNAQIIFVLISVFTILSLIMYPTIASILGTGMLLLSFALGIYTIFQKYKETKNSRIKIAKDTLIFIAIFLLISFLGGIAGLFTNFYVSNLFSVMTGFISAMLAGIVVGYLVRKCIIKFIS